MHFVLPRFTSLRLLALATVGASILAACSTPAPPPLPPAPIPQHALPPPPVALSSHVVQEASEFRSYVRHAEGITPTFASGQAIEESLATGEHFEAQQLSRGAIAYAAVIALQEPGFVAGVRTYAVDPTQRRELAQKLLSDPYYATALPGSQAAAGLIIANLNADGARIRGLGEQLTQFARDVQHQAWSKGPVVDPAGRLASAKTLSAAPMSAEPTDLQQIGKAVTGSDSRVVEARIVEPGAAASAPPFTQVVTRGLAVAALAALGEAGDENDAAVQGLLTDANGGFCLNMSKLNLYQCLAVAKPWYEDIFCLGQHILIDTGQCIAKAAGQSHPVQSMIPPSPTPAEPACAGSPTAALVVNPPALPIIQASGAR